MTPFDCGYIHVFFLHFIQSEIIPMKNFVSALFTEYSFNKLWCLRALMQNSVTCIKVMNMLSIHLHHLLSFLFHMCLISSLKMDMYHLFSTAVAIIALLLAL